MQNDGCFVVHGSTIFYAPPSSAGDAQRVRRPTHDHSELITLIESADGAAAAHAMSQHLTEIEDRLDLSTVLGPLDLNQVFARA
jgi:DNA-binding GntR family transcriptional regulator